MSSIYPSTKIYINKSNIPESGKGVFAAKNIKKGETIEVAPILILSFDDFIDTKWNLLFEYYFWMDNFVVLAMGYASFYNHAKDANAKYEIHKDDKTIIFTATEDIKKDQEIYFNYKGTANPKTPLWFERSK